MIEQRVTLRYGAQQIPAVVQAVQGDTGRDVIFELADYEIPAGATANYYIDKPDGNAVYNSAEVISSTEILAHLTEQALAVPGRNNGQVRILADGEVITSFDFVLEVEAFRGILHMQSETEINIFDQAIEDAVNTATEEAVAEIQAQTPVVTGMQNSIAPTYSSSSTYAVGDYVMYNAQLYRCITAITTAEAWTASHWTQVPLAGDVSVLKRAINNLDIGVINIKNDSYFSFNNNAMDIAHKQEFLNKLRDSIDAIETVFYQGYASLGDIIVTNGIITYAFYLYPQNNITYQQSSSNVKKILYSVSAATLQTNGLVMTHYIQGKAGGFRIRFNQNIIAWLTENTSNRWAYSIGGADVGYVVNGFKPIDVTNRKVWNKGFATFNNQTIQRAEMAFSLNDALLKIESEKENTVFNIYDFSYADNIITIRIAFQTNTVDETISSSDSTYRIFTKQIKIANIPIQSFNVRYYQNVFNIDIDVLKLIPGGLISTETSYESPFYKRRCYKKARLETYGVGYINNSGELVNNTNYRTYIAPINEDCKNAVITGIFDANANIGFVDKSGYIKEWAIKNADGTKYSGGTNVNTVEVEVTGYAFLIISTWGDLSGLTINIQNYDENAIFNSYNKMRYDSTHFSRNIHLLQAVNGESGIFTATDRAIQEQEDLIVEEIPIAFTDPVTGYSYNSAALLDADASNGIRYFISNKTVGGSYMAVFWKEQNGNKTVILRAGEEPPIDFTIYPEYAGCNWMLPGATTEYPSWNFIRCLSDGELLIGMALQKPVIIEGETKADVLYVVMRTTSNQAVWVPKFVTSSQHYVYQGSRYHSFGYPTKATSIHIKNTYSRNLILISEYGSGTSQYWREQGVTVNGRGVSGKMWLSIDNGNTFKKIFDFDQKKNGIASDTSDDNWKWCTSATGREAIHIHGCYIDTINGMIWMTNGDGGVQDSHNGIYYANTLDLINWMLSSGTATDPHDLYPAYYDNEVLPNMFHDYVYQKYVNGGVDIPYYANVIARVGMQAYCFLPTNKMLLIGHDVKRDIIYGIHNDLINRNSMSELHTSDASQTISSGLFLDVFGEIRKNATETFPQQLIQKENGGLILALEYYGIAGSFNGIDWKVLTYNSNIISFLSYAVKDIDGKFVIVKTDSDTTKSVKITNY